ncbi:hypothetical protein [Amycolatopsis deserti]|uniref:hypothetical protein n=1 Tax=Amycolatopsis deserti TaxID=185696 RepID=UPI00174A982B|nr:hypothetical protein [Amycolatopsis deserti]
MAVAIDNPAGRLHAVFREFSEQQENLSLDQAWANTIGCSEADRRTMSEHLTEIAALLHECRAAAQSIETDVEESDLLYHFPEWGGAIFGFSHHRAGQIKPKAIMPPAALSSLGTLARLLHLHVPEWSWDPTKYSQEALSEARSTLEGLIEEINGDDSIPEAMRARISRRVGEAVDSIKFVRYRGVERLREDLAIANNALHLQPQSRDMCSPGVLQRIDNFAHRMEVVASRVWAMISPPVGAIYILHSGDVMGGAAIMASNPRVSGMMQQLISSYKSSHELQNSRGVDNEGNPKQIES